MHSHSPSPTEYCCRRLVRVAPIPAILAANATFRWQIACDAIWMPNHMFLGCAWPTYSMQPIYECTIAHGILWIRHLLPYRNRQTIPIRWNSRLGFVHDKLICHPVNRVNTKKWITMRIAWKMWRRTYKVSEQMCGHCDAAYGQWMSDQWFE